MTPDTIEKIFATLQAHNPSPTTELAYNTPFELMVAVILSAQSTDVGVNKATAKLFPIANTPQAILALGLDGLKSYIKTIGLYNTKADNILKTCQILLDKHHGLVPEDRESLEALPGVGRKTANVLLNTLFGQDTIAVDTHIFRVANRTGLAQGKTPLTVEQGLMRVIPPAYAHDAHHWLVLHGRYVCTARSPKCPSCCIRDYCEFSGKTKEL